MNSEEILNYCLENLSDTVLVESYGEKGIYYNPNNVLKRGIYILTIKENDGKNDKSSKLYRPNTFRVSLGLQKNTFSKLFGIPPKRPKAGMTIDMDFDFSSIDQLLPHPVYAWMSWICVINPTNETFEILKPLINESYEFAKEKFHKRMV